MKVELKTWAGLGLATALMGAGLAGCAGEGGDAGASGEGGEAAPTAQTGEGGGGESGEGEGGEGGADTLTREQRLVFMAGHVEAGIALYRAGDAKAAAPHLLHPVSETHESERAGLAEIGFDPAPYESVSKALEAGKPAEEIEPALKAVEENLAKMRRAAGGDAAELIRYLMDVTVAEYKIAVTDGKLSDPGEYQDAWGFITVARDLARSLDASQAREVGDLLDQMLALWPKDAPTTPEQPAPDGQVSALAAKVLLALPQAS
jgi:hypothetical protein